MLTAAAVDHWFREPPDRWHPVAWLGSALAASGAPWPRATPARAFAYGVLCWLAGAILCVVFAALLVHAVHLLSARAILPAEWHVLLQGVLLGMLLKPLVAWRMLRDEVLAVQRALERGIDPGRLRLSGLVSRDTTVLDEAQIRESALESLAENLNDSWVAPLFWFAVGGLPAAALYRFANTADAMWGYRGRFEWAGKWAARADDIFSYIPARITGVLLAAVAGSSMRELPREAGLTTSPNSGWPMAMMALALGVRLSKPGVYALNAGARCAQAHDVHRGVAIAARGAWASVGVTVAAVWLVSRA